MEFITHNVANALNQPCRGMWIEMTLMIILLTSAKRYPPCRGIWIEMSDYFKTGDCLVISTVWGMQVKKSFS